MGCWWQEIGGGSGICKGVKDRIQRAIGVRAIAGQVALLPGLLFLQNFIELISIRRAIEVEIVVTNNYRL